MTDQSEGHSRANKHVGTKPNRRWRIGRVFSIAGAILLVIIVGCGKPSFTRERYERLNRDNVTQDEVVAVLGPGEEVKNDYTGEQIELHNLPADTTFLRWKDPDDSKALTHIGFSNGKVVHRATLHTD